MFKYFSYIFILFICSLYSQNKAFYLSSNGNEILYDVVQLSDGSILISGVSDNLDWVPDEINARDLGTGEIANNQGNNNYAFMLQTDQNLDNILNVVYISQNGAEDIRFIKLSNEPRQQTEDIYISGNTNDDSNGGYFIGKLNNNFINGIPTGFEWTYNAKCTDNSYQKRNQPWDVDQQGRVYFMRGDSHDWSWSALYRLNEFGELDVVENWRTHWIKEGGEFHGTPASSYEDGISQIQNSGIIFKKDNRCNLRSWSQQEYELIQPDGNGGTKQGKWPLDVLFDGPCIPGGDNSMNGPGYSGYRPGSGATWGPSSIAVDRRNGDLYFGFNAKSRLPDGNPDFEPAVVKMDSSGKLIWWSRLYHEVRPDGTKHNSSPDQYIDGLAVDYSTSLELGSLIVNARCHGNNVENFWEGNTIAENENKSGFQNQFTGTSGNIHIGWLGKLALANGKLSASTYIASMGQNNDGLGQPHPNEIMDGWANLNSGWINVNTTRLKANTVKTTADGSVLVVGVGRRPATTKNAFMKMPNPYYEGKSAWSSFVRQYNSELSLPKYSSIIRGTWDTLNTQPSNNVDIHNVFKTSKGIITVGSHKGEGNNIITMNNPSWGKSEFSGRSGVITFLTAPEIENGNDSPNISSIENDVTRQLQLFPNPTNGVFQVSSKNTIKSIEIYDNLGNVILHSSNSSFDLSDFSHSVYHIKVTFIDEQIITKSLVKN